jgi:hypothetical protein
MDDERGDPSYGQQAAAIKFGDVLLHNTLKQVSFLKEELANERKRNAELIRRNAELEKKSEEDAEFMVDFVYSLITEDRPMEEIRAAAREYLRKRTPQPSEANHPESRQAPGITR